MVLTTLAEEPALLRVALGDSLVVGEVTGEFLLLLWAAILSLTDVDVRFCRLRVSSSFGLAARRGSLGGLGASEVWGDDL